MAKKTKQSVDITPVQITPVFLENHPLRQTLTATGVYCIIATVLTFPLIFRMNSTIYGPYDHVTTDLFTNIHTYFWWLKESIVNLHRSPFHSPMIAAPFETKMTFVNLTGFIQLPLTVAFGPLFSRNFTILFNLVVSGLGMFLLVRHLTRSAGAGFIAGIVFAFCPNMMVRSYTTFDSTQVQWIPLYTLYLIRFVENRTWKNIMLTGFFLVLHIVMSFPYYLVYLPVHTVVVLASMAGWQVWGAGKGAGRVLREIMSSGALRAYGKIVVVLAVVTAVFVIFYTTFVGGGATMESFRRSTEQLEELSLKPTDYFVPHPSSALLKGSFTSSYWDDYRTGKDPNTFVAYIGYIALCLMIVGILKGRGYVRWMFIAGSLVAFWSTLGPSLFGIPTPSGLIHSLYAPFARRIMIYKVFVQFGVAGLAGIGISVVLSRLRSARAAGQILIVATLLILAEYTLVPPALSVDLTETPEIYRRIRDLPDNAIIMEVPPFRVNHNAYQGYLYYQTYHRKRLFNPQFGAMGVPEHIQPFYKQMEVPFEACEYFNLAALRYLGVTHLTYHWFIGTLTTTFQGLAAPALYNADVYGLRLVYECPRDPKKGIFKSPYDYTFADLYEITAEPCPVALVLDYRSPYEQVPGIIDHDFPISYGQRFVIGWASALFDTTGTFYYPIPDGEKIVRILRQGGRVTAINLSDEPVDFSIQFEAQSADSARVLETRWNDGRVVGSFTIGPEITPCQTGPFHLDGGGTGILSIWSTREAYGYSMGGDKIPAMGTLRNFRVIIR